MAKTNKSILKRLKITKTGKMLRGGSGINHFLAKKSRHAQLHKKRLGAIDQQIKHLVRSYLHH